MSEVYTLVPQEYHRVSFSVLCVFSPGNEKVYGEVKLPINKTCSADQLRSAIIRQVPLVNQLKCLVDKSIAFKDMIESDSTLRSHLEDVLATNEGREQLLARLETMEAALDDGEVAELLPFGQARCKKQEFIE